MDAALNVIRDQYLLAEMLNDNNVNRLMAIDKNWNIIAWNKTSENLSGISKNKILGKNLLDTFPQIINDEEMLAAITGAFEGRKMFLPPNLSSFNRQFYENHFIPLSEDDEVIGVMNIMQDVSHRIKVEKQLQSLNIELEKKYLQLEKANDELAAFTYISSRDIKEPLKRVCTSLERLVKKEAQILSDMSRRILKKLQGSLDKMNPLIDDMLAVSCINGNYEQAAAVELDHVLQHTTSILHNKLNEKKAVITAVKLPAVRGYRNMLNNLFMNIIDNALKFQSQNEIPRITITSRYVGTGESPIQGSPEKKYIKLSFTDNGIGFDTDSADKIFALFEKLHDRKYPGPGIGLTVSKKIMEVHDGYMEVESEPYNGSSFHCYFPVNNGN